MYRLVLDTNVLVSGTITRHGPPAQIVDLLHEGLIQPLFDARMLREYDAVLRRPKFKLSSEIVDAIMDNIRRHGESIVAASLAVTLPDPTDLPFLEVAVAGRAQSLVTGNGKDYVPVQGSHVINVNSPREFLDQYRR